MSRISLVFLSFVPGGLGLLCLFAPGKVRERTADFNDFHVRSIGFLLLLTVFVLILEQLTIDGFTVIVRTIKEVE